MKFSEDLLYAAMVFSRTAIEELGDIAADRVDAMFDAFDPQLKNQLLLMAIKGVSADLTVVVDHSMQGQSRQKIQAIKEIRALGGFGLKEAKDLVDEVDSIGRVIIPGRFNAQDRGNFRQALAGTGYKVL